MLKCEILCSSLSILRYIYIYIERERERLIKYLEKNEYLLDNKGLLSKSMINNMLADLKFYLCNLLTVWF